MLIVREYCRSVLNPERRAILAEEEVGRAVLVIGKELVFGTERSAILAEEEVGRAGLLAGVPLLLACHEAAAARDERIEAAERRWKEWAGRGGDPPKTTITTNANGETNFSGFPGDCSRRCHPGDSSSSSSPVLPTGDE